MTSHIAHNTHRSSTDPKIAQLRSIFAENPSLYRNSPLTLSGINSTTDQTKRVIG